MSKEIIFFLRIYFIFLSSQPIKPFMKKVIVFLMFAMTVLIAASNATPERIPAPDVDVGYVIDINNYINAEAILSESTMFTIETTGDRQEGVAETTIRSGPMTTEDLYPYVSTRFRYKCDHAIKPAIVFRV
jgi:hypothetical protein